MAEFGEIIVIYDLLPELVEKLDKALDEVIRKAAFDIQAHAQAKAPVDTGFLKNSIYVKTEHESTYNDAQEPQEGQTLLPEVAAPPKHQAVVAVGANYGVYVEFGSAHGPAQPYLEPAVAEVMPVVEVALEKLEALMEMEAV